MPRRRSLITGSVLLGVVVLLLISSASAATREFLMVTGEWSWHAKKGEAEVVDRNRGQVDEIERYTFDPAFVVVNKGDTVILKIHVIKGSQHLVSVPAFGVSPTTIRRGEEKAIQFVADKAGIFEIRCDIHNSPASEGPMVGYIYVAGE
ncbi:MAG: hypothetical protein D6736_05930 [Nitrospinota bacterium]|nr:MAG: hypothetical protein D6736_05930 [Nitrospinota bacterium]